MEKKRKKGGNEPLLLDGGAGLGLLFGSRQSIKGSRLPLVFNDN
jgi:hypothetical protein